MKNIIIIKDIILIILLIAIIYLTYKITFGLNNEKFSTTDNAIKNIVDDIYKIDIDAMRNLASISNNILIDNTLNLPADKVKILGDLETNSNVIFTNKNTNIMEIYPQYMIIPWGGTEKNIPKGWAQCDGSKYILKDGIAVITNDNDTEGIITSDLRGSFILASDDRVHFTYYGTEATVITGGSDTCILDELTFPSHSHYQFVNFTEININNPPSLSNSNSPIKEIDRNSSKNLDYRIVSGSNLTPIFGKTSTD
jgi:hypothetical protein